jgi:AcrR family transcriptional regulator
MTDPKEPTRFERRKRRTHKALKQAALELVLEKGYDSVTIQDIVDHADYGRGTFYLHFDDKESVVWEIIMDGLDEANQQGHRRSMEGKYPPGYLGYLITFEHAEQNRDLYRLMMGSQGSSLLSHRVAQVLAGQIESSIRSGMYDPNPALPPDVAAQSIVGALVRLVFWWLDSPNEYTPRQMADMLWQMVHHQPAPA